MKRLTKKGNLVGKKIRFLEDVIYCTIEDINKRMMSGVQYKGTPIDGMIQDEIEDLLDYLDGIGFIKNNKVVIPNGTEATIIYDNVGNDIDLKINNELVIVIINDFSFDENATDESIKAEIVE